jgi:hypothetical protein
VTHFPADRSGGFDLIRVRALRADQREGVAAERGAGAATLIQVKVRKNEWRDCDPMHRDALLYRVSLIWLAILVAGFLYMLFAL